MRVTPGGLSICKFGLAVTRVFTSKDGEKKEETAFIDIDAFGRQAETISKYLTKGRPIFVEGRLKFDQWESKEGEKRSKLGVILENFQFLNSRSDSEGGSGASAGGSGGGSFEQNTPPPRTTQPQAAAPAADDGIDEDVPF